MVEAPASSPQSEAIVAGEEPTLELPVFKVREEAELPQREAWRYGTIPGFEILSNTSDVTTMEWIHDLQAVLQVGELVWPIKLASNRPMTLILCDDAAGLKDFGFEKFYREKLGLTRVFAESVSDWEQLFFIQNAALNHDAENRWRRLAQLYYYRCGQTEPRPPEWMAHAGRKFISTAVSMAADSVIVGKVHERYYRRSTVAHPSVQLSEIFRSDTPVGDQTIVGQGRYWREGEPIPKSMASRLFSQFLPFAQFCLLDEPEKYESGFVQLINRARMEPVTAQLFEECFGKSVAAMEEATRDFQGRVRFIEQTPIKTIKGTLKYEPVSLRDATDAEVGRIKGEALALLERPQVDPRAMLRAPYVRGERDPQLLAAIGLHEQKLGNAAEARRFLETAVRGKVKRPRAYLELARIHYDEILKTPAGPSGTLSAEQIKPVMELLEAARGISPKIPEVYDLIAEVCARAEVAVVQRYLTAIDEGLRLFPYHAELVCQGAAAFAHAGYVKEARQLIEYGQRRFRHYAPEYRGRLTILQSNLPAQTSEREMHAEQNSRGTSSQKAEAAKR
ncbi:tetratricopeptide repeat protein [Oleiharenicola lentus]|uniref:tetratricopeptide repeat protein n=1 Tax=Oleiharenicola lentus TaxID=2508720 RepID=UPI003F67117A